MLAQKLLFREVTISSASASLSFRIATKRSTPRGRALGDAVRRLRCVLDAKQPHGATQTAFVTAMSRCPKLQSLSLAIYAESSFLPDFAGNVVASGAAHRSSSTTSYFKTSTLAALRQGPHIRSLHLDNWTGDVNVLSQLLDVWPSLSSLSISGTPPSSSDCPTIHAFKELRANFQTPPPLTTFKWLLGNSLDTLRVLRFDRDPPMETLEFLVETYGARLMSTTLPSCSTQSRAEALARCANLLELCIPGPRILPGVYRDLPSSLEHLTLWADSAEDLACIARAVKRTVSLQTVRLYIGDVAGTAQTLAAVRIACTMKGVELVITRDILAFRNMVCSVYAASGSLNSRTRFQSQQAQLT